MNGLVPGKSMSFRIVKITSIFTIFVLSILLCFGLFLRAKYIFPVLMYHYIEDTPKVKKDKLIVTPKTFQRQMYFLKANEYRVISLEELAESMRGKKKLPKNTVVITFDDGHLDNYGIAYPILKKYDLKAAMFIVSGIVSRPGIVTEMQIKEMSEFGLITIGSHTVTHPHLPSLADESRLRIEIFDSKKKLEEILNKPVNSFNYPMGGFDKKVRDLIIEAGYSCAVATSPGIQFSNDDVYAIKRVRISEGSKNLFVFWFEASGLYRYLLELRKSHEFRENNMGNIP